MEVPALGQEQARARAAQQSDDKKPEFIDATCAFIVYQTTDGIWIATQDLDTPVTVQRQPTPHDYIAGGEIAKHTAERQLATQETTMNVVGNIDRRLTDPQYQMTMRQATETARAAMAAANGR